MFRPVKFIDVDFQHPIEDIENLNNYGALLALIRLHGTPIGYVKIPLSNGRCTRELLVQRTFKEHGRSFIRCLLRYGLTNPVPSNGFSIDDLLEMPRIVSPANFPLVTIAVCTRDRTASLSNCLSALAKMSYPALDVLVIDNAPRNSDTECLLRDHFPMVRYVKEVRPGLDWARNRAIQEARGEIIAFTDDDALADPRWVSMLVRIFSENPNVMAVTGLVVPYQLETEAQVLFEEYGGFGRGFRRQWYRLEKGTGKTDNLHIGAGRFGTGANMAYRRSLFDCIGYFDPALDVGTVTNGGGDLEMFFRVLQEGFMLVYEPSAIVRHVHRRTHAELKRQITDWGIGFYSYLVRCALVYPSVRLAIIRFGILHLWHRYFRPYFSASLGKSTKSSHLIATEFLGVFPGLFRYFTARRVACKIGQTFGPPVPASNAMNPSSPKSPAMRVEKIAVRMVDLNEPLSALENVSEYASVRLFLTWRDKPLGHVDIANHWQRVSVNRLGESIADALGARLLDLDGHQRLDIIEKAAVEALLKKIIEGYNDFQSSTSDTSSSDGLVSIVLATYDRPDHLHHCLQSLQNHESGWEFEIIVVDNNPESNMTPPIVAKFPGMMLVPESQKGLSYARNAGILYSRGDYIVTIDDDVIIPPGWLDKLLAPFSRDEVMVVTGNVLPRELESRSQLLFEIYGGLGRGYQPLEADRTWFESYTRRAVPTWQLGAGANAAFRSSIFLNTRIGLLNEALGAGTPTGCSEDTYLFYKVLKEGGLIQYEPAAYVWHSHRCDLSGLRRQLYNYSKGHVAYHLITLLNDHDIRGLVRVVIELPLSYCKRILKRLLGYSLYPIPLILIEIGGSLAGPFALWKSCRNVKRCGRSPLYVGPRAPEGPLSSSVGKEGHIFKSGVT
jgi:GT2 family glycosyltransferase